MFNDSREPVLDPQATGFSLEELAGIKVHRERDVSVVFDEGTIW